MGLLYILDCPLLKTNDSLASCSPFLINVIHIQLLEFFRTSRPTEKIIRPKIKHAQPNGDRSFSTPFIKRSEIPFAEAHHIFELAVTRIDHPSQMMCVCPTCHRVIHYGNDESLKHRESLKR
jgi:hypothetical protein